MERPSLGKLAYQTLQQSKGIVGIVHKEVSTKLMELVAPEAVPQTSIPSTDLLNELRNSIKEKCLRVTNLSSLHEQIF